MKVTNAVGMYAWGGPGTIRLLQVKYKNPQIDTQSFNTLYSPSFLKKAKQLFGVTDMWVTYSWGFSDAVEKKDRQFLRRRLGGFVANGISSHAYVQGFNLVLEDFDDQDYFAKSPRGTTLLYSKGRGLTCPNNPYAVEVLSSRVHLASQEEVTGVFVDNIMFGHPPAVVTKAFASWFGCACSWCKKQFKKQYGYALPVSSKIPKESLGDYLRFRSHSVHRVVKRLKDIARRSGKLFGVNFYDPLRHQSELYYGYKLSQMQQCVDYILIENHAIDDGYIDNSYMYSFLSSCTKPVFIVSYNRGIGYDAAYGQEEIDMIMKEAKAFGYHPCIKASEFFTRGVWHAIDLSSFRKKQWKPMEFEIKPLRKKPLPASSISHMAVASLSHRIGTHMIHMHLNSGNYRLREFFGGMYTRVVKKDRSFDLEDWR